MAVKCELIRDHETPFLQDANVILPAGPLHPEDVEKLWELFADVPVNEVAQIEEPFICFPAGTDRLEIFHWFNEHYPGGVIELMFST